MDIISEFEGLCRSNHKINQLNQHIYEYAGSTGKRTLTFAALIHGNETGGLHILIRLLNWLASDYVKPQCNIRFILGNLEAYKANKRFIETDLNRSFAIHAPISLEEKRAKVIEEHLPGSDLLIDFHQTLEPSNTPFFVFTYNAGSHKLARALDEEIPIITFRSFSASSLGKGLSFAANLYGAKAITIETGEKGASTGQIDFGFNLAKKAITLLDCNFDFETFEPVQRNCFTWGQTVSNPDFTLELAKRLKNFELVEKGEILATLGDMRILSEYAGPVLFPKYGEYRKHSLELVRVLRPITSMDEL